MLHTMDEINSKCSEMLELLKRIPNEKFLAMLDEVQKLMTNALYRATDNRLSIVKFALLDKSSYLMYEEENLSDALKYVHNEVTLSSICLPCTDVSVKERTLQEQYDLITQEDDDNDEIITILQSEAETQQPNNDIANEYSCDIPESMLSLLKDDANFKVPYSNNESPFSDTDHTNDTSGNSVINIESNCGVVDTVSDTPSDIDDSATTSTCHVIPVYLDEEDHHDSENVSPNICTLCGTADNKTLYKDKACISKHVTETHIEVDDAGKSFVGCPHCDRTFIVARKNSNASSYLSYVHCLNHMVREHDVNIVMIPDFVEQFKCKQPECSFKTLVKSLLSRHMKIHENPFWKCPHCYESVKRMLMAEHKRKCPENKALKEPSKCTICDEMFSSRGNMETHINNKHNKSNPFVCDICSASFQKKNDLQRHMFTKHRKNITKLTVSKCKLCDFETLGGSLFRKHMLNHEAGHFPCKKCSKVFETKNRLNSHMKAVHVAAGSRQCHQCNYKCSSKFALERHIKAIHSMPVLKCDTCRYSCKVPAKLDKHMKIHGTVPMPDDEKSLSGINSTLSKHLGESQVKDYMAVMEEPDNCGEKVVYTPNNMILTKYLNADMSKMQPSVNIADIPPHTEIPHVQQTAILTPAEEEITFGAVNVVAQFTNPGIFPAANKIDPSTDVDRFINKTPHKRKLPELEQMQLMDTDQCGGNLDGMRFDGREEIQGIDYETINAGVRSSSTNTMLSPGKSNVILSVSNDKMTDVTDSNESPLSLSTSTSFMCDAVGVLGLDVVDNQLFRTRPTDDLSQLLSVVDNSLERSDHKDFYSGKLDQVSSLVNAQFSPIKDTRRQDTPADTSFMEPLFRDNNVNDSMFDMNMMRTMYNTSPSATVGILGSEVLGTEDGDAYISNLEMDIQNAVGVDHFGTESVPLLWTDSNKTPQ